jgi:signal transduction histidine kinase
VTVSCGLESDGSYKITVEDTGVGIAEENLTKVLEPFVQVESAYSRRYAGTGLGLPLVRKIVELHDGKVELRSKLGLGTAVIARFPAARVRPAADHNVVHLAASA